LFSSAATDLSISLACAWALRSRIRGFSPETDTLLRRLTFIFVRTAAYTTIASLLAAILFAVYKEDDLNAYIAYATWTPGVRPPALLSTRPSVTRSCRHRPLFEALVLSG